MIRPPIVFSSLVTKPPINKEEMFSLLIKFIELTILLLKEWRREEMYVEEIDKLIQFIISKAKPTEEEEYYRWDIQELGILVSYLTGENTSGIESPVKKLHRMIEGSYHLCNN